MPFGPLNPPTAGGGGSVSDVLSVLRNIVTAINDAATTYLSVNGARNYPKISTNTLISQTSGRIAKVSVTTAGAATGLIYDSNNLNSLVNPVYVIPTAVGVYEVNIPVGIGILVAPGTSQVLTLVYS